MELNKNKLKVLLGIDESYTNEIIKKCFQNRSDYDLQLFTNQSKQQKIINDLYYDIYWLEYEYLNFEKFLDHSINKKILFNSYCIRKGLIRKAQMAYYIKKYILKNPLSVLTKSVPETYIFELDHFDYLDEALNDCFEVEADLKANETREKTVKYILKPSIANRAAEIMIFDKRSQLEEKFYRSDSDSEDDDDDADDGIMDLREWVIQRYIDEPCLINSRKFHLRVYVVAIGDLEIFVYENILALFCQAVYDETTLNLDSHITNTCFQYSNKDFDESECVKEFWSLKFSDDEIECLNIKNSIFSQIKNTTSELFKCLYSEKIVFQPLENGFELYGFDFLVDKNYNCYFLEANAFPDFKQTGNKLNDLISTLFYQTIAIAVDSYFNIPSVCNANKMHSVYKTKK